MSDIFETLPPILKPKIFPGSASVNSVPFGIVKDNKNKIWEQRDNNKNKTTLKFLLFLFNYSKKRWQEKVE